MRQSSILLLLKGGPARQPAHPERQTICYGATMVQKSETLDTLNLYDAGLMLKLGLASGDRNVSIIICSYIQFSPLPCGAIRVQFVTDQGENVWYYNGRYLARYAVKEMEAE